MLRGVRPPDASNTYARNPPRRGTSATTLAAAGCSPAAGSRDASPRRTLHASVLSSPTPLAKRGGAHARRGSDVSEFLTSEQVKDSAQHSCDGQTLTALADTATGDQEVDQEVGEPLRVNTVPPSASAAAAESPLPSSPSATGTGPSCLPSWNISKSRVWSMVQNSLAPIPATMSTRQRSAVTAAALAGAGAATARFLSDAASSVATTAAAFAITGTATVSGLAPLDPNPPPLIPMLPQTAPRSHAAAKAKAAEASALLQAQSEIGERQAVFSRPTPVQAPDLATPAGMGPKQLALAPTLSRARDLAARDLEASSFFASRNMVRFSRQLRNMANQDGGTAVEIAAAAAGVGAGSGGVAGARRPGRTGLGRRPLALNSSGSAAAPAAADGGPLASSGWGAAASAEGACCPVGSALAAVAGGGCVSVDLGQAGAGAGRPAEAIARSLAEALHSGDREAQERDVTERRVRAVVAGASVAWAAANLTTLANAVGSVDWTFHHDITYGTKTLLDVLFSWGSLGEVARELAEIGVAVGLGMAQRDSAPGSHPHSRSVDESERRP